MDATLSPPTVEATGTVLSLDREADRVVGSVADRIAKQDADLRPWMARRVIWAFIGANVVTLIVIGRLVWLDQTTMQAKVITPGDHIIGQRVILGLLGATTVQVGTIAAIIARYL